MTRFLTAHAAALPSTVPFTGPETLERRSGIPFRARLGANESLFGPSPKAIAAMRATAGDAWMYGDPENHDLKQALASHLGVSAGHIAVGPASTTFWGFCAVWCWNRGRRSWTRLVPIRPSISTSLALVAF